SSREDAYRVVQELTQRAWDDGVQLRELLGAGERAAGLARLRQAAAAEPRRADHHDRLVAALVWCGELDAAVTAQRQRIASVPGDEAAQARLAALEQAAAQPAPPPGHVLPLKPPGAGADRNA
ncbi:MAG: hypothetical protein ACRD1A_04290, partial [Terriglobales bacterium]